MTSEQLKPQGASEEPASYGAAPFGCRRILVVEDNLDAAETLKILLQWRGHKVHLAFDGLTGLEAARTYRPELALLDIGLPGMDGYELAEKIKKQPELRDVVLVALTGRPEDRRRAQEAGFDYHLTKPLDRVTLERLLAVIK